MVWILCQCGVTNQNIKGSWKLLRARACTGIKNIMLTKSQEKKKMTMAAPSDGGDYDDVVGGLIYRERS